MLNPDPAKLRYLGIDLHSRTRRRIVVVLTWLAFVIGMSLLSYTLDTQPFFLTHPIIGFYLVALAVGLFTLASVFRDGGVVKPFHLRVWHIHGMHGDEFVLLRNLDDWARYQHGARLTELPEEQQREVLRTYRVGYYVFPADKSKTPERLDEREVAVRNQASTNALKWVTLFCFSLAGAYATKTIPIRSTDVAMTLLTLGIVAFNGPRSLILWNEPDPRENGDLALVQQVSASQVCKGFA
jgi:hypothetical protein